MGETVPPELVCWVVEYAEEKVAVKSSPCARGHGCAQTLVASAAQVARRDNVFIRGKTSLIRTIFPNYFTSAVVSGLNL